MKESEIRDRAGKLCRALRLHQEAKACPTCVEIFYWMNGLVLSARHEASREAPKTLSELLGECSECNALMRDCGKHRPLLVEGRDPTRIQRILLMLREVWEKHPGLRLGQLVRLVYDRNQGPVDAFYVEDHEWEVLIRELL